MPDEPDVLRAYLRADLVRAIADYQMALRAVEVEERRLGVSPEQEGRADVRVHVATEHLRALHERVREAVTKIDVAEHACEAAGIDIG